ncbi:MAG: hypothetical protein KR126chlam3_00906 [Chlamydiae bacterium]|nr:hypothetical protein [Chlamydiota bacterium]
MKYLIGMLLMSGIAFASPVSYKEKGDTLLQVEAKKKKKKKGCGCGSLSEMHQYSGQLRSL